MSLEEAPSYEEEESPRDKLISIEAEQMVLGCILMSNDALHKIDAELSPEDFSEDFHQRIYSHCVKVIEGGGNASPLTLGNTFADDPAMADVGPGYFARLAASSLPASVVMDQVKYLRLLSVRRGLYDKGNEIVRTALHPGTDATPEGLVEGFQASFDGLIQKDAKRGSVSFDTASLEALSDIERAFEKRGSGGILTGIHCLDRHMGGFEPTDLIVIAGRPGMGKAQPLSARILLEDGTWKNMGDLKFGDRLASVDGLPSVVAGIFPQGEMDIYEVTFRDGRRTRATADHLWQVESSRFTAPRTLTTREVAALNERPRTKNRLTVPAVSGDFGVDRDVRIDPWLLGAMIGDGNVTGNNCRFSTADEETVDRLVATVGAGYVTRTAESYDYRISRTAECGVLQSLEYYGLRGKRSEEKFIPDQYLSAKRSTRLNLLRGLMDTDGWVESFGAVRYVTSSPRLAKDVQRLVWSLGGRCTINKKTPHYTHKGNRKVGLPTYILNMAHKDRASLISLSRKKGLVREQANYSNPPIISIRAVGRGPCQCIKVSHPSSLYVTDDYIVTHNTALATNISVNMAKPVETGGQGKKGLIFSMEMSASQLATRILSGETGLSSQALRMGHFSDAQYRTFKEARNAMRSLPLEIDERGGLTIGQLASKARRVKRKQGLDFIVIDYIQLMRGRGDNRVHDITIITEGLKALAKELKVPVIALSQLSRAVEARAVKRPLLSDLRESGSIEQDADVILFPYRPEYYLRLEGRDDADPELKELAGTAELILAKWRHGPVGDFDVQFDAKTTTFRDTERT